MIFIDSVLRLYLFRPNVSEVTSTWTYVLVKLCAIFHTKLLSCYNAEVHRLCDRLTENLLNLNQFQ